MLHRAFRYRNQAGPRMREYHSTLAPYIVGLIKQKQACGYSYDLEAYILESFDQLCIEHNHSGATITRDLVMQWAIQRPTEGKNYRNLLSLVCTPTCTVHAIAWARRLHPQAFCFRDRASTAYSFPGRVKEFLCGRRRLYASRPGLSPIGFDLSSSVSSHLLLRPASCRRMLLTALMRRFAQRNDQNPALQRQQRSVGVPFR